MEKLFCLLTTLGVATGLYESLGGNREHDLFSSTDSLRRLFDKEKEMHSKLRAYLEHTGRQIRALDELIENHYKDYDFSESSAAEYVSNPINTYALLKRTGLHWPRAKSVIFNETAEKEFQDIREVIEMLPTQQDLQVWNMYKPVLLFACCCQWRFRYVIAVCSCRG